MSAFTASSGSKPPRSRRVSWSAVRRQALRAGKSLLQYAAFAGNRDKAVLLIVGCQRSGTDLMERILDRDLRAKVYPEVSALSSQDRDRGLRLDPLPRVKSKLERDRAALVVLKPLVESQNARVLLDTLPGSRAIWLYRDHRAVANSHVEKWGGWNSRRDLQEIVEDRAGSWRNENVSAELRDIVARQFGKDLGDHDAAALYWYVRNRLFFDLRFDEDERIFICSYERLVSSPVATMKGVYEFIGQEFPGEHVVSEVHPRSIDKGDAISLSPDIACLCRELERRLALAEVDDRFRRMRLSRGQRN